MSDDAITASKPTTQPPAKRRFARYGLYAIGALMLLLIAAYVDGGEEPLHQIEQSVAVESLMEAQ